LTQIAAQMEAAELEQASYTNELGSIKVEYENLKKEFKVFLIFSHSPPKNFKKIFQKMFFSF